MRYLRAAGAACLAVVAMLAVAGGASASVLTQAPPYTGVVEAESEGTIELDGSAQVICQKSTVQWSVEEHGTAAATGGPVGALTFEECGSDTVTVFNRGRFDLHATGGGDGTMTWTNAEFTVQKHFTVFGFPVTTHCIYTPTNTSLGTFTGSISTKATAKLDVTGPGLPKKETDGGCGEFTQLTATYSFTSPDYLIVE